MLFLEIFLLLQKYKPLHFIPYKPESSNLTHVVCELISWYWGRIRSVLLALLTAFLCKW